MLQTTGLIRELSRSTIVSRSPSWTVLCNRRGNQLAPKVALAVKLAHSDCAVESALKFSVFPNAVSNGRHCETETYGQARLMPSRDDVKQGGVEL